MPYRIFVILFIGFSLLLISVHYHKQYQEISRKGGSIQILGYTIYSSPGLESKEESKEITSKHIIIERLDIPVRHDSNIAPLKQHLTCPPRKEKPVRYKPKEELYSWKDENGRIIFSDRTPGRISEDSIANDFKRHEYTLPDQYFDINIDLKAGGKFGQLKSQLEVSLRNVYLIMSHLIGKDRLRLSTVNLRIYGTERHYHAFRQTADPLMNENIAGFYLGDQKLAVTYNHHDSKQTVSISLHESFHVLAHELFVNTPTWLNEGLAEYFETMTVMDKVATIHPQEHWGRLVRQELTSKRMSLRKLINMAPNEFYGPNQSPNYASAWSLVSHLMATKKGRQFLANYMQYMFDNYCQPLPTLQLIEHFYPGGFRSLETEWYQWVVNKQDQAQTWTF